MAVNATPKASTLALPPASGRDATMALANEAKLLSAELKARTGNEPKTVREELRIMLPSEIRIDLDNTLSVQPGGYTLEATPKTVVIKGKDVSIDGAGKINVKASSDVVVKGSKVGIN